MIEYLRTPHERADRLPVFLYPSHYVSTLSGCENLRLQCSDEGPRHAEEVFR